MSVSFEGSFQRKNKPDEYGVIDGEVAGSMLVNLIDHGLLHAAGWLRCRGLEGSHALV